MIIPSWRVAVAPFRRGSLWPVIRQLRALRALAGGYANRALTGARRFAAIHNHKLLECRVSGSARSARPCIKTPHKRLEGAQCGGKRLPLGLGAWRARLPERFVAYPRGE